MGAVGLVPVMPEQDAVQCEDLDGSVAGHFTTDASRQRW